MIAPADYPPHPIKGRIMLDGYNNCLIWEHSRARLLDEEKQEADYRKSIAGYSAPWNPAAGQRWLDLKTNRVMIQLGGQMWYYADNSTVSTIPIDRPSNHFFDPGFPLQNYDDSKVEPIQKIIAKPEPKPEPEKPEKSRVFTLK